MTDTTTRTRVNKRLLVKKAKEMADLIPDKQHWVQGQARTTRMEDDGEYIEAFCLVGARDQVLRDLPRGRGTERLREVLGQLTLECIKYHFPAARDQGIVGFNDTKRRAFKHIRTVLDCVVDDAENGRY